MECARRFWSSDDALIEEFAHRKQVSSGNRPETDSAGALTIRVRSK